VNRFSRLGFFCIFSYLICSSAQAQYLLGATPKPAPLLSLKVLTDEQVTEIETIATLPIEKQIGHIKKKVPLELLSTTRKGGKHYFDSIGPAQKSIEQITNIEGLYGKAVCPKADDLEKIYIAEDAPPATLLHEYVHHLQMQKEKRWCSLDGRVLDPDEKREQALLYHRFEFEVLKTIWDLKEKPHYNFEDRIILIEGLSREAKFLKNIGITTLSEDEAQVIENELNEVRASITILLWLNRTREDAGTVMQKMEILTLKACVEQTLGFDELSKINDCVAKRCSFSKIKCLQVSQKELGRFKDDMFLKVIHAWLKPNIDPNCPETKLRDELTDKVEEPTGCWKSWYIRHAKQKKLELDRANPEKMRAQWKAPKLPIDKKIGLYLVSQPESFINHTYCYFIYQRVARFDSLPINQFPYAVLGASMNTETLKDYRKWLDGEQAGVTCSKLVKVFSGEEPSKLKGFEKAGKYVLVMNSLAALTGGMSRFKDALKIDFNHERLHLIFADDKKLKVKIKAEWEALSSDEQEKFKSAHTSYDFRDQDVLLREYFSYSRQENPTKL
jgi:hypothetical protein